MRITRSRNSENVLCFYGLHCGTLHQNEGGGSFTPLRDSASLGMLPGASRTPVCDLGYAPAATAATLFVGAQSWSRC